MRVTCINIDKEEMQPVLDTVISIITKSGAMDEIHPKIIKSAAEAVISDMMDGLGRMLSGCMDRREEIKAMSDKVMEMERSMQESEVAIKGSCSGPVTNCCGDEPCTPANEGWTETSVDVKPNTTEVYDSTGL